jgi:hypothetical protein
MNGVVGRVLGHCVWAREMQKEASPRQARVINGKDLPLQHSMNPGFTCLTSAAR